MWKSSSWTPDDDCPKGLKKKFLSTLSFPGEKYFGLDPTRDKKGVLLDKMSKIFDKLLADKVSLSVAQFMVFLVKDEELLPELQEWTDESSGLAKEMFSTLDMNKDDILDDRDVEMVSTKTLPKLVGQMEDRFADMMDMITDQRVDFSLAGENGKSRTLIARDISTEQPTPKDEL